MARPVTLFTGQWADLPLEELASKCGEWGFDGLELACWGDHFDVAEAMRDSSYAAGQRELLERHLAEGTPAAELLAAAGPGPISDDASLLGHVDAVIAANPRAVADYRAGKPVAGFFVGLVMKATAGAADAARVTQLVRERLASRRVGPSVVS